MFAYLFVRTFSYLKKAKKNQALEIFFFLFHDPWGIGVSKQRETVTITHPFLHPATPPRPPTPADRKLNSKI